MKKAIKSAIFFCLYYSGLEWLMARLINPRAVAVLMYHGVCDNAPMPAAINFHLKRSIFERQMRALKRRYPVIPLGQVVRSLKNGEPLQKAVVLTFDDGYRNNATRVWPVLNRLGLPFSIFLATKYIGTSEWIPLNEVYWMSSQGKLSDEEMTRLRTELRSGPASAAQEILGTGWTCVGKESALAAESFAMLSWDEVRQLAAADVEFGSHTHSHCNMAAEPEDEQRKELTVSKRLLEENLHSSIQFFAYPYGRTQNISDTSQKNIVAAGYDCAISAGGGLVTRGADRFRMPRLGYDQRVWFFLSELLYQFVQQALRDVFAGGSIRVNQEPRLSQSGAAKEKAGAR
jgi:peptidoglycan/xylan/chitin deacetylase (PgdA/CDA1 family)